MKDNHLEVGFPVDYRYGCDGSHKEHQQLLGEIRELTKPEVLLNSPASASWTPGLKKETEKVSRGDCGTTTDERVLAGFHGGTGASTSAGEPRVHRQVSAEVGHLDG